MPGTEEGQGAGGAVWGKAWAVRPVSPAPACKRVTQKEAKDQPAYHIFFQELTSDKNR